MTVLAGIDNLGIIAGGGDLPVKIARSALSQNIRPHILGFQGEAEAAITEFSHDWMKWGEVGRMFKILAQQNITNILIIGSVTRPELDEVHLDFGAVKLLPAMAKLMAMGDDGLLTGIVRIFEKKGFRVLGVPDIAPEFVVPTRLLSRKSPTRKDIKDIEKGRAAISGLSQFDIGQAMVVVRGRVLAVEAVEGTDRMLERCAELRLWAQDKQKGVLVKIPKLGQELRVDMPTIGPRTVELVAKAGLSGIAVQGGATLMVNHERVLEQADAHKLFLRGLDQPKDAGQG